MKREKRAEFLVIKGFRLFFYCYRSIIDGLHNPLINNTFGKVILFRYYARWKIRLSSEVETLLEALFKEVESGFITPKQCVDKITI